MRLFLSNTFLKIWLGVLVIAGVVGLYAAPVSGTVPCSRVSDYPDHSEVFQCHKGLNAAVLTNMRPYPVFTTISTDVQTQAWLTKIGDGETVKTLQKNLGYPVVLGPGAFMAVSNGAGLVYIVSKTQFLLTVAWSQDVPLK